ncbi:hypothetical protein GTY65_36655 [Streptomyces sp. SID8379]|uniref:hypothetical protein n=1 Tax=unclassified Streptomyces TaxID=2593676 RepID=UPI000378B48A|nr:MULTISPECIES: hypothetical protein [unclassified Streptomyces]MYW69559.1 hypothetical protein [Streptomyces sp. SID8379]
MADGYEVDLDALDQVVKELNQVLKDMGGPKRKAAYSTYVPKAALGNFDEAQKLADAHDAMKTRIEQDMIAKIEKLIDKFGRKTEKARGVYQDAEADNSITADRNA